MQPFYVVYSGAPQEGSIDVVVAPPEAAGFRVDRAQLD
jgi:hypothetical protein